MYLFLLVLPRAMGCLEIPPTCPTGWALANLTVSWSWVLSPDLSDSLTVTLSFMGWEFAVFINIVKATISKSIDTQKDSIVTTPCSNVFKWQLKSYQSNKHQKQCWLITLNAYVCIRVVPNYTNKFSLKFPPESNILIVQWRYWIGKVFTENHC